MIPKTLIFTIIALFLTCNIAPTTNLNLTGDGVEYLMMTESLAAHLSPEMRQSDVDHANARNEPFSKLTNAFSLIPKDFNNPFGYFPSKSGAYYSYHFWFYPLANLPAFFAVNVLKLSPTFSFYITNSLAVLACVLLSLSASWLGRMEGIILSFGTVVCGSTYYLKWTHPEVFTFCFVVMGCILFLGNRFKVSALLLAISAQQNPPIGFLCATVLAADIILTIRKVGVSREAAYKLWPILPIGLVLTSSPVFYLALYGTPNLIAAVGATSTKYMTLNRFLSFFFDLDQGLVVGVPVLIPFLAAALVLARDFKRPWWIYVVLAAAPVVFAIPATTTLNWNSGVNVVMRYAYWTTAPWLVLLATLITACAERHALSLAAGFLGGQIAYSGYLIAPHGDSDTLHRSWAADYAITKLSRWYNPDPAIYIDRIPYQPQSPSKTYFTVHNKRVVKILINERAASAEKTIGLLCGKQTQYFAARKQDDWLYINPMLCGTSVQDGYFVIDAIR